MDGYQRRIYSQRYSKEELLDIIQEMDENYEKFKKAQDELWQSLDKENKELKRKIKSYEKLYNVQIIQ